jgi:hypothetical protein
VRTVRAEYELQPELLDCAAPLAEALGDDARVRPLPAAGGPDLPPDGLWIELDVDEEDPFAAVEAAAVRLAEAFRALGLPIRAVSLECEGLLPIRIETLPRITPYTG